MINNVNIQFTKEQLKSPFFLGHKFHLVKPSPWPAGVSMFVYPFGVSFVAWMNRVPSALFWTLYSMLCIVYVACLWFRDIIRESTFQGYHTTVVQRGISIGFAHFIISETMIFASFFSAFKFLGFQPQKRQRTLPEALENVRTRFIANMGDDLDVRKQRALEYRNDLSIPGHKYMSETAERFAADPYLHDHAKAVAHYDSYRTHQFDIELPLDAWGLPTYGTFCLLLSAVAVTLAHRYIRRRKYEKVIQRLIAGLILGATFVFVQAFEYSYLPFSINTDAYASCFYLTTGFHGLHVIVGLIFLLVATVRTYKAHFNWYHHLNLEFASYYWHFVDVIWIFLYLFVYHSNSKRLSPIYQIILALRLEEVE